MSIQILYPCLSYALTGGPTQPEVQGFEPVGTSDMVDLFSGDFKYNIPLLDVDGYPINLSYHSGIMMDEEASWVGLGWNINVGTVNRAMRGIPDDFAGDPITKELNMKANQTFGLSVGVDLETVGLPLAGTASVGAKFNTYKGMSMEKSVNVSINTGDNAKGPLSGSLGLTASTDEGVTIQPSLSLSSTQHERDNHDALSAGISVGTAFNSRAGLKQISFTTSFEKTFQKSTTQQDGSIYKNRTGSAGMKPSTAFNIGMPTYSFTGIMPMNNFAINGLFKFGQDLAPAVYPSFPISGYYAQQTLVEKTVIRKAYGYLNLDLGINNNTALLDFNRENDGGYIPYATPNLAVTNLTNDIFSVTGQGIDGSYKPVRSDIGYVYDPYTSSDDIALDLSLDLSPGTPLFHVGANVGVTVVNTKNGAWTNGNLLTSLIKYKTTASNPLYEKCYFVEANEMPVKSDQIVENYYGGFNAVRPSLLSSIDFNVFALPAVTSCTGNIPVIKNYKSERESRNQVISTVSRKDKELGLGADPLNSQCTSAAKGHHVAEVDVVGTDGVRYIYGIAAYNTMQREVSFAVGDGLYSGGNPGIEGDTATGLIRNYPADMASPDNNNGTDHYFSRTTIPAYAHSFLLTEILSADYVDADDIAGASDGDLGTYTHFYYSKHNEKDYQWRLPVGDGTSNTIANFDEGLKTDLSDDKGSYIYGTKELWYLDSIVTKNYIAIFDAHHRIDGLGVKNENGELEDDDTSYAPKVLDRIRLYTKPEYRNAINSVILPKAIKIVNFQYSNSLCKGVPNTIGIGGTSGKLTLTKVFFTYQTSLKGRLSPYKFFYSSFNPNYNAKGSDRWGNYKPNPGNSIFLPGNDAGKLRNSDNPYVVQDSALAAKYSSAWELDSIKLPTGGSIKVTLESDDYAYVQDHPAGQMFELVDYSNSAPVVTGIPKKVDISTQLSGSTKKIYFKLQPGFDTDITDYFKDVEYVYFKFLMNMNKDQTRYDFVPGYGKPVAFGITNAPGPKYGWVKLESVHLGKGTTMTSPMTRAAIQFGRLHLSRLVYDNNADMSNQNLGFDILSTFAGFLSTAQAIFNATEGPNGQLYNDDIGKFAVTFKSWIRLSNPNCKKLGGGCRVKKIILHDEWNILSHTPEVSADYGLQYSYQNDMGHSSGVATYEPQLGGDENSMHQPVFFEEKNILVPDNKFYQETPIGESLFPSPSVGYSMVTVSNLQHTNVTRHAAGKQVYEYFTSKDFPTIESKTDIVPEHDRTNPSSIKKLFEIDVKDYLTVSQGFCVEVNDMNGKPKRESVYSEGQTVPISSLEYFYKQQPYSNNSSRLMNNAIVIHPDGTISTEEIGVTFDLVGDMREEHNETTSAALMINADFIPPGIPIPGIWPSFAYEQTQFRSATLTKTIQRFGILEKVIKKEFGSIVETENLAYDSETGKLLLTKTTTDFNDSIFTLNFPARWFYVGMRQACYNTGLTINILFAVDGVGAVTGAKQYFALGDELGLIDPANNTKKGWVIEVDDHSIKVMDKQGAPVSGTYEAKVLRSGHRNLLNDNMASISLLENPLTHIKTNEYQNILTASAQVYSNRWRTFCDCFPSKLISATSNPYVLGINGNWRVLRTYTHLAPRKLSYYNNNTYIRSDGTFTSFYPFYKLSNGSWQKDESNWTYASEVTEFSPFGQELENRDALGRYSAANFGYNQSLPIAVAANSRYGDIGFDNFEDHEFSTCADNHFKFLVPQTGAASLDTTEFHTGRTSLKVYNSSFPITKDIQICEPLSCDLNLVATFSSGVCYQTSVGYTGTNDDVQFNYNILSGNPSVQFLGSTLQICGSAYSVQVIVTDASGCTASQIYTH